MTNLSHIAAELGVSTSLVSKVLNNRLGSTNVRPEVRDSIRDAAERLGYRKNQNSVSLLARRLDAFAVLICRHGSAGTEFPLRLLEGISGMAAGSHQRMMLQFFHADEGLRERVNEFHSGIVDGLIVHGSGHPGLVRTLFGVQQSGLKLVTVFNRQAHPGICNVSVTDESLSHLATRHLIERGSRRIVHFGSMPARTAGFRRAMAEAGLRVRSRLLFRFDRTTGNRFEPALAGEAIRELLRDGVDFDGVSAQSDAQAVSALHELLRHGRSVPGDVRVVGIDNAPFTNYTVVPLTSVSQRIRDRGRIALGTLLGLIDGEPRESIVLEPEIRIRGST